MRDIMLSKIYESINVQPVKQPRFIVREYNSKAAVKKAIVDANDNFKIGTDKRGAIRIQPSKKVEDREELKQLFTNTLDDIDLIIKDTILPGTPESPSSKYMSYVVQDKDNNEFIITLGGGSFSNAGMNYERELMKELENYFDNKDEGAEKPAFLDKLEQALDIEFEGLDTSATFARRVRRPLSDKGPSDKGDEISDLTLIATDDGKVKKFYISLKNVGGKTISNAGAKGMFEIEDNKVEFVNKEKNSIGKKLLDAANVNIDLVERGLTDYVNKSISSSVLSQQEDVTDDVDKDKLIKFIGSAFDYGYIYVKQKNSKNDLEVADLTEEDKLYDFIGDIENVYVKYPYYINERKSRKNISIVIETTKGVYSFDIRNAGGNIEPNQINLVRAGSKKDIQQAISNIKSLETSTINLKDTLSEYD
jgi:hypothetical protein